MMKLTFNQLRTLICEIIEEKKRPQKGDRVLVGDDWEDSYTEDKIYEVTPQGVYVSSIDDEIDFSELYWYPEKDAWVDAIAYDIIRNEEPIDSSLSDDDNKILRLLSNAATSTTTIDDVSNFQIRPLKKGIKYIENSVNVQGFMSAKEIKNFTGMSVSSVADWMFNHGAKKMKQQKRLRDTTIYD